MAVGEAKISPQKLATLARMALNQPDRFSGEGASSGVLISMLLVVIVAFVGAHSAECRFPAVLSYSDHRSGCAG
jgi:hypothetical protein